MTKQTRCPKCADKPADYVSTAGHLTYDPKTGATILEAHDPPPRQYALCATCERPIEREAGASHWESDIGHDRHTLFCDWRAWCDEQPHKPAGEPLHLSGPAIRAALAADTEPGAALRLARTFTDPLKYHSAGHAAEIADGHRCCCYVGLNGCCPVCHGSCAYCGGTGEDGRIEGPCPFCAGSGAADWETRRFGQ